MTRSLTSTPSLPPSWLPGLWKAVERERARRMRPCDWNLYFLPDYFRKSPPADFHAELDRDLHRLHLTRRVKRSYIAPRDGAKSTWLTLAYVLRVALEKWEPYTLILSDSSDQADQLLGHVRKEIEDNVTIATVYAAEAGAGPEWKGSRIRLRNGALVESLGRGKKVRGRRNRSERPTLVIFDDIQSNEDIHSPIIRQRAWDWATREVIPAGGDNANFLAVGSALHRDAVSMRIGNLAGWTGRVYKAVHEWPARMDLWEEFERIAINLADDHREETARRFYAANKVEMDRGGRVYWPDRFPLIEMMLRRAEVGSAAFESEYQGVPGSLEGSEWPSEYFDRPNFWFEDWPGDLALKIQSLDPSKGSSDVADYQAHIKLALSRYGTFYVEADLRKESAWVERAIDIAAGWNPIELIAEANNTMGLLRPAAEQILEERRQLGRAVHLVYNERINTTPKAVRIRVLNDYLRLGQLRVRNTRGGRLLVEQLRDWPHGDNDDGPDALATAVIRVQELAG